MGVHLPNRVYIFHLRPNCFCSKTLLNFVRKVSRILSEWEFCSRVIKIVCYPQFLYWLWSFSFYIWHFKCFVALLDIQNVLKTTLTFFGQNGHENLHSQTFSSVLGYRLNSIILASLIVPSGNWNWPRLDAATNRFTNFCFNSSSEYLLLCLVPFFVFLFARLFVFNPLHICSSSIWFGSDKMIDLWPGKNRKWSNFL